MATKHDFGRPRKPPPSHVVPLLTSNVSPSLESDRARVQSREPFNFNGRFACGRQPILQLFSSMEVDVGEIRTHKGLFSPKKTLSGLRKDDCLNCLTNCQLNWRNKPTRFLWGRDYRGRDLMNRAIHVTRLAVAAKP